VEYVTRNILYIFLNDVQQTKVVLTTFLLQENHKIPFHKIQSRLSKIDTALANSSNTVVVNLPHHPKVQGSNFLPIAGIRREKWG
jgi:hypothetical protein